MVATGTYRTTAFVLYYEPNFIRLIAQPESKQKHAFLHDVNWNITYRIL